MIVKLPKHGIVKHRNIVLYILLLMISVSYAQVGIGNTNPQATLDITASNQATPSSEDGILIPRVDTFPTTDPTTAQQGMLIYLTTDVTISSVLYPKGFYHWDVSIWVRLTSVEKLDDLTDAKTSIDGTSVFAGQFAGINDDGADRRNTGLGYQTLQSVTTGNNNNAMGYRALQANITGFANVAIGNSALSSNTGTGAGLGNGNTAVGSNAMQDNTASQGTAVGYHALFENSTGEKNTAVGWTALSENLTGENNSAFGHNALAANTTGANNTSIGNSSMLANLLGSGNVALGANALRSLMAGADPGDPMVTRNPDDNTAIGSGAMYNTVNSINNTSVGSSAGFSLSGDSNVAVGHDAGRVLEGNENVLLGDDAGRGLVGDSNVFIGERAGRNIIGDSNVFIGYNSGFFSVPNSTISSTLLINNSNSATPLIYGDFANDRVGIAKLATTYALEVEGTTEATQFKVSALNTTPASNTAAGVAGEIRVTADYIYICTATNVWKRVALDATAW